MERRMVASDYPPTRIESVAENIHGQEIIDPYRWLEDVESPEVTEWATVQNEYTDRWLEKAPVEPLYQELLKESDIYIKSSPWRRGDTYFWYERQPGQNYHVLFSAPQVTAEKTVVFDPNELSEDGSVSLSFFRVSRTARYAVYGTQESGTERDRIYIRDMQSGKDEEFYFGRTFNMSWCNDEKGFYYTRSNYQEHGGDLKDETHFQQVYYHQLGEPRDQDRLIFDAIQHLPKDAGVGAHDSEDGKYVFINASIGWSERKLYLLEKGKESATELLPDIDALHSGHLLDGYVYLTTNYQANNWRVLRIEVEEATKPLEEWEEFIPEKPEHKLEGWQVTKNQIIAEYMQNAMASVVRLNRQSGHQLGTIDLPPVASLAALNTSRYFEEFYYSIDTFLAPATKYRYNPDNHQSELYWKDSRSLDERDYEATQEWFTSKDDTKIPMFVIKPRKLVNDGNNPVILMGYGGFGIGEYPDYIGHFKPLLERGGVLAIPNLRGGDEFGEEWHLAGTLENKQNTFDDMIAAAEHLISKRITRPERLGIIGGSNGGLLVGAMITQRPELFGAAVSAVPLLDMLRYHKFLMAHRWTREYGNPENPEEFQWLLAYSPYHHVESNAQYPTLMLTAGMNDSRVHPLHAWKMAAKLQAGKSTNLVLLRTEIKAGHGPGKGFYQGTHDFAERLAFLAHCLGMRI